MADVVNATRARMSLAGGLRQLPGRAAPLLRLNGLAPYYTMFPLAFPFDVLGGARHGDWVLDPFCGRGTTILAARLRGLPSVGVDSNPVAGAIAAAKLARVRAGEVVGLARAILSAARPGPVPGCPRSEFWGRCYAPATLRDICRIRNHLLAATPTRVGVALRGLMLGILHGPLTGARAYLSNQMPRTYATKPTSALRFWQRYRLDPPEVDVLAAVERRARFSFHEVPPSVRGKVVVGDSRAIDLSRLGPRFTWVVTSPPYYGMRTYFPDQWLRNWFVGGPADVDYQIADQVSHRGEDVFVGDLAAVWRRAAVACRPGAKLVCRFGALGSCRKDPRDLIRRTLNEAACGWKILTVRDAGTAQHGNRQCDQFGAGKNPPVQEIDVYAVLES